MKTEEETAVDNLIYTVETRKGFEEAVRAVEETSAAKGFRVLHTHDVSGTLAEKGFPRDPVKIVEICNAKAASEVLNRDIRASVMLPCHISVYVQGGKTYISTMMPSAMEPMFPNAGLEKVAAEVERTVLDILNTVRG